MELASRKSTSGMMNRQEGKRFVSIRSNRLESPTFSTHPQSPDQLYGIGFTHRFPVCRIANTRDVSTLVGCIEQPSPTSIKFTVTHLYTWVENTTRCPLPGLEPARPLTPELSTLTMRALHLPLKHNKGTLYNMCS